MNETLNQIRNRIDELMSQKEQVIVAIDGKCTAGKTTLAGKLAEIYDCNVFHMDDFFLRPEQRTPERFAEVGGNVDYTPQKDGGERMTLKGCGWLAVPEETYHCECRYSAGVIPYSFLKR